MLTTPLVMVPLLTSRPPRSSRDWPPRLIAPPWEAGVPTVVVLPPPRTREEAELFTKPPAGIACCLLLTMSFTLAVQLILTGRAKVLVPPFQASDLAAALVSRPLLVKLMRDAGPD